MLDISNLSHYLGFNFINLFLYLALHNFNLLLNLPFYDFYLLINLILHSLDLFLNLAIIPNRLLFLLDPRAGNLKYFYLVFERFK